MKSGLFQFSPTPGVLPPGSVSNNELAEMAALTVKANATNATAHPQDVAAASADTVFARVGTALQFSQVTDAMMQNQKLDLDGANGPMTGYVEWASDAPALALLNGISSSKIVVRGETGFPGNLSFIGEGSVGANVQGVLYRNAQTGPRVSSYHARGTEATPTALAQFDQALDIVGWGYTGASFVAVSQFLTRVRAATPGSGDMESDNILLIVPAASATASEIRRWSHAAGLQMYGANTVVDANRLLIARQYTVATLPVAPTAGATASVTDATAPAKGVALVGGGAVSCLALYSGGVWVGG